MRAAGASIRLTQVLPTDAFMGRAFFTQSHYHFETCLGTFAARATYGCAGQVFTYFWPNFYVQVAKSAQVNHFVFMCLVYSHDVTIKG